MLCSPKQRTIFPENISVWNFRIRRFLSGRQKVKFFSNWRRILSGNSSMRELDGLRFFFARHGRGTFSALTVGTAFPRLAVVLSNLVSRILHNVVLALSIPPLGRLGLVGPVVSAKLPVADFGVLDGLRNFRSEKQARGKIPRCGGVAYFACFEFVSRLLFPQKDLDSLLISIPQN